MPMKQNNFINAALIICIALFSIPTVSAQKMEALEITEIRDIISNTNSAEEKAKQLYEKNVVFIKNNQWNLCDSIITRFRTIFNVNEDNISAGYFSLAQGELAIYRYSQYHEAIDFFEKASKIFVNGNDRIGHIKSLQATGVAYIRIQEYGNANSALLQALKKVKDTKESKTLLAAIYGNLSIISDKLQEYEQSARYMKSALNIWNEIKDPFEIGKAYHNLAWNQEALENNDSAIYYFNKAIDIFQQNDLPNMVTKLYMSLSSFYSIYKEYDKAEFYIIKALSDTTTVQNPREIAYGKKRLADVKFVKGEFDTTLVLLYEAEKIEKEIKNNFGLGGTYEFISDVYFEKEEYKEALEYFRLYQKYETEALNETKMKQILTLQAKYDTQQKENKINQLRLEAEKAQQRRSLYIVIFSATILILLIVLIHKRITSRVKQNLLLSERNLAEMELEQALAEISTQKGLLNKHIQNIVNKNELIEELQANLEIASDQQKTYEYETAFQEIAQFKILTNDDWLIFTGHFDVIQPGYRNKLRNEFPNLTEAEQRLFIMLSLKLSSKEIASMLAISGSSVKKARNRLRKKLQLSEEVDLQEYVNDFEQFSLSE